jgi:hypothetical protein
MASTLTLAISSDFLFSLRTIIRVANRSRMTRSVVLALTLLCFAPLLHADPIVVSATVTQSGSIYTYDYTVTDNLPPADNDVFLIDVSVPAVPGSVYGLAAPDGFKIVFDSGLGLLSFLEDTNSFNSTPVGGFMFMSLGAPGPTKFEASVLNSAYDLSTMDGATVGPGSAGTDPPPVPEPGTMLLTASGFSLVEVLRRVRHGRGSR